MCDYHQGKRPIFCEECVIDLNRESTVMTQLLMNRWDRLWDRAPGERSTMINVENEFPISATKVLETIPIPKEFYLPMVEASEARRKCVESFLAQFVHHQCVSGPGVRFTVGEDSFIIYQTIQRKATIG